MPTEIRRIAFLLGGGAALIVVGVMLPWASLEFSLGGEIGSVSQSGISTPDGKIMLVLGLVLAAAAALLVQRPRAAVGIGVVALLMAVGATLIGFADIADIRGRPVAEEELGSLAPRVGIGLYACTAGGIVALLGATSIITKRRQIAAATATDGTHGTAVPPPPPSDPGPDAASSPSPDASPSPSPFDGGFDGSGGSD